MNILKVFCEFRETNTAEQLYTLLHEYDYPSAVETQFVAQKTLLKALGTHCDPFYGDVANCQIIDVDMINEHAFSFYLEVETAAVVNFWKLLYELFISLEPRHIIAAEFVDRISEWSIYFYDGHKRRIYETGLGGELDELIYNAEDHDEVIDIAFSLIKP